MAITLLLGGLLALLALGTPLTLAMALPSIAVISGFQLGSLNVIPSILYASLNSFPLLAVPFFIAVGYLMTESGMAGHLVDLATALIGRRVRASVGYTTVLASVFLAGISGSSTADTAALTTALLPSLKREGFRPSFAVALTAVGGGIGLIIPPSIVMVIYGLVANVSIGRLFFAGILPGLVTSVFLAAVVWLEARKLGPVVDVDDGTRRIRVGPGLWGLGAPVTILGGIYFGIVTPTESAAIAVAYVLIVGMLVYRRLTFSQIWDVMKRAAVLSSAIMVLTAAGALYAWVIIRLRVADVVIAAVGPLAEHPLLLVLVLNALILVAGAFVEPIPLIYMTIPVFVPLLQRAGVDLVYFGVVYTINLAIAQVTPPVGANLFVAAGVAKMPIEEIVRGLPWLLLALIAGLLVTILVPGLSLLIPGVLYR